MSNDASRVDFAQVRQQVTCWSIWDIGGDYEAPVPSGVGRVPCISAVTNPATVFQ